MVNLEGGSLIKFNPPVTGLDKTVSYGEHNIAEKAVLYKHFEAVTPCPTNSTGQPLF
jgi:hypothetical protein